MPPRQHQEVADDDPASIPAGSGTSKAEKAQWEQLETKNFLQFLVTKKDKAGDGGNFPGPVFTDASSRLQPDVKKGAPKTAKVCQDKYAQLRGIYSVVDAIRKNSGWHWDNEKGACITAETQSTWDDYVTAHPKAKPFKNKGWEWLALMDELMPPRVSGAHVYHASLGTGVDGDDLADKSGSDEDGEDTPSNMLQINGRNTGGRSSSPAWGPFDSGSPEASPAPKEPENKKRPALSTPPRSRPVVKKPRVSSGSAALAQLANSVTDVGDSIRVALAPADRGGLEATPRRVQRAIMRAQQLEAGWLTSQQLVAFINILENNTKAVNTYAVLMDESLRKSWIKNKLGLVDFDYSLGVGMDTGGFVFH
ncbi:hypothetical protein FB451DRAFT_1294444 [Mycena latifolia]|nr:hypothetical protein FB451DRAFT_1294444 [Mycena latifolia]